MFLWSVTVIPVQNKEKPLLKLPLKQLYAAVGWTDGASQMTLDTKCKQVNQVLLRGEVWVLPNVQNKLPWSIMAISASIMDCSQPHFGCHVQNGIPHIVSSNNKSVTSQIRKIFSSVS